MIADALRCLGLSVGETVLIHSDLTALRGETGMSWGETAEKLKQDILEYLGPTGTLLVPTFSWDFCQGKPYKHEVTRSHLGLFSNNILFDKRAIRSVHPIFSFAGIGPAAEQLLTGVGKSSFGKNSVFERLLSCNVTILLVNSISDIAFVHYVEQQEQVGYRFMKYFSGDVYVGEENIGGVYDFFARRKNDRSVFNGDGLYKLLIESGAMTEYHTAGGYPVCRIMCQDCNDVLTDELKRNPAFLRSQG